MFVDDLKEALLKITQSFDSLADIFAEIFRTQEDLLDNKGTPPQKYGQRKHRQREKTHLYRYDAKPHRNLPYQRRSY